MLLETARTDLSRVCAVLFINCYSMLTQYTLPSAFTFLPLRIGDHVFIGPSTIVEAASIGSHVHVGEDVIVGKFAIIKDYVRVLDGTIIPDNMVIPSFSIVAGQPARVVGEIPEGGHEAFELRELYRSIGNAPPMGA